MKSFLILLKEKAVIGGIFMAILYQVIMIGIFIPGYSAVPKNIPELSVAIVNNDTQYGQKIAKQLQEQLPFHIVNDLTLDKAQQQLEDRVVHMIVHIPQDFTQKLSQQGEHVKLDFFINQSNPAVVTSAMQQVVTQVTEKFNGQLAVQNAEGIFKEMNIPTEQAQQLASSIPNKLTANVVNTNPIPVGMHNTLAPMFLTMVSYVGAMIYSMMIVGAVNSIKHKIGKWKAFFAYQGVNVLLSLVAPLVGLTIYFSIHGYGAGTFTQMWLLHALEMFGAISFTSMFIFLFGQAGTIVNITLLLAQAIAGGSVMTQEMMPGVFKFLSHISVMYYSIQTDFNILFGGGKTTEHILGLVLVALVSSFIGALVHHFKPQQAPVMNTVKAVTPENLS